MDHTGDQHLLVRVASLPVKSDQAPQGATLGTRIQAEAGACVVVSKVQALVGLSGANNQGPGHSQRRSLISVTPCSVA